MHVTKSAYKKSEMKERRDNGLTEKYKLRGIVIFVQIAKEENLSWIGECRIRNYWYFRKRHRSLVRHSVQFELLSDSVQNWSENGYSVNKEGIWHRGDTHTDDDETRLLHSSVMKLIPSCSCVGLEVQFCLIHDWTSGRVVLVQRQAVVEESELQLASYISHIQIKMERAGRKEQLAYGSFGE